MAPTVDPSRPRVHRGPVLVRNPRAGTAPGRLWNAVGGRRRGEGRGRVGPLSAPVKGPPPAQLSEAGPGSTTGGVQLSVGHPDVHAFR